MERFDQLILNHNKDRAFEMLNTFLEALLSPSGVSEHVALVAFKANHGHKLNKETTDNLKYTLSRISANIAREQQK